MKIVLSEKPTNVLGDNTGLKKGVCPTCNQPRRDKWFYLKRTARVIALIIGLKLLRQYLANNKEVHDTVLEVQSLGSTTALIHYVSQIIILSTLIVLATGFTLYRKSFAQKWLFSTAIFALLDGVFMYFCPEITASVLEAVFLHSPK